MQRHSLFTVHTSKLRPWQHSLLCLALFVSVLLWTACQPPGVKEDGSPVFSPAEKQMIYSLSPLPAPPPNPSNTWADDPAAAHFGQYLFYDPRLSGNGKISCASCHNPALGWSDGRATAMGLKSTERNSPSLWNSAYQRWLFWDGRSDSLWSQALQPLENHAEMGISRVELWQLFQSQADLKQGYEAVFGPLASLPNIPIAARPASGHSGDTEDAKLNAAWNNLTTQEQNEINRFLTHLGKALEAFERKIISGESPFDRYVQALRDNEPVAQQEFNEQAQKGLRLFIGRGQCILCHSGPQFSDGEFHNLGLPAVSALNPKDPGRFQGIQELKNSLFNGLGAFSDLQSPDDPWADKLHYLTQQESNLGEFRTPGLREVAETGPYMHDGRFAALEQVLAHYSTPPDKPALGRREDTIQALNLKGEDIQALKAFLKSLSSGPPAAALQQQVKQPVLPQP
jgi:cytochrome c peroxidase